MRTTPWLNETALRILELVLFDIGPMSPHILEWGAGGSTRWLLERKCLVWTVEHDPKWIDAVKKESDTATWFPLPCTLNSHHYTNPRLEAEPDAILIDGRRRVECLQYAIGIAEPGCWIMLDDSQRPRYKPGIDLVPRLWPRIDATGMVDGDPKAITRCTFWRMP